ncbi:hypothetical protein GCM10023339_41360 [Alloalcanivorax gelatiniphagus]
MRPAYDKTEVAELLDQGSAIAEDSARLGLDTSELESSAAGLVATVLQCDDTLGTRRTTAIVLFGLAVLAPATLFFVIGSKEGDFEEEDDDEDEDATLA